MDRPSCPRARSAAAALAACLLLPLGPAAAGEPLGLAAAQQLALSRSMALPAQDAAAAAARERAVAAGQRPDPVLRIGLDNVPIEGSTDSLLTREPTTARSIGISQALPDEAKRFARTRLFDREADLAAARRALEARTLRRETALAWFALRAEGQRLQVIDAQRVEAVLVRDAADAAWRAGRGAQADLFVARGELARLDDERLQAEARRDLARTTLQRWVGADADRPLADGPALQHSRLGEGFTPARLAGDPALLLAQARESAAAAAADLAREEVRADWSVDLRFAQRGPRFDNMLSVGLSRPLRWDAANRQEREVAARDALRRQAQAETEELRRERDAELVRWQQRWRSALARLAVLDDARLPWALQRSQAALAAYRAGTGGLQPVLDARAAEQALRLQRVQIEFDAAADWARLDTLIPTPNEETTP